MKTIIIAVVIMTSFLGCKSTTTESQVETAKDSSTVVVDTVLVVTDTIE